MHLVFGADKALRICNSIRLAPVSNAGFAGEVGIARVPQVRRGLLDLLARADLLDVMRRPPHGPVVVAHEPDGIVVLGENDVAGLELGRLLAKVGQHGLCGVGIGVVDAVQTALGKAGVIALAISAMDIVDVHLLIPLVFMGVCDVRVGVAGKACAKPGLLAPASDDEVPGPDLKDVNSILEICRDMKTVGIDCQRER